MIRSSEDEIRAEKTWGCLLSLRLRLFLRCEFVLSTPPFLFASCFLLLFKHGKRWLKYMHCKNKNYTYPWESSAASKQTINPNWCYCSSQRKGNWTKILNHWPGHTLYFRISIFNQWKCKHNFSFDFTILYLRARHIHSLNFGLQCRVYYCCPGNFGTPSLSSSVSCHINCNDLLRHDCSSILHKIGHQKKYCLFFRNIWP